jgi:hypothetical protein
MTQMTSTNRWDSAGFVRTIAALPAGQCSQRSWTLCCLWFSSKCVLTKREDATVKGTPDTDGGWGFNVSVR